MAAQVALMPAPDDLALMGDLSAALDEPFESERYYSLAEAAWISDAPDPARLARFLSDRNRRVDEAVVLARAASADRADIFTADALAWALYRAGHLDEASGAIETALATGSKDRTIRYHAAAIAFARGDRVAAGRFIAEALDGAPHFDLVVAPAARALERRLSSPEGNNP
jgi:tetratricopeptide (TPR) repeat protein